MTLSKCVQPALFCFTTSVLSVNTASLNRSRTDFLFPFFTFCLEKVRLTEFV